MFIQKYLKCECCELILPRTRQFFKRDTQKEHNSYHSVCKTCEDLKLIDENWKNGKLKCWTCKEWLDPEEFDSHSMYKYRNHKDKRCKKCKRKLNLNSRINYSSEKKLIKVLQDRWLSAKRRSEIKNIEFSITKEDLKYLWDKQKGLCALSGIPMTYEIDSGRVYTNVSIDLIKPSEGYTLENILLVCMGINQMKSDLDMQTLLFLCKSLIDNLTNKTLNYVNNGLD